MTSILGFVDDGGTIARYIEGIDRLHRPMRVTFRPVVADDNSEIDRARRKLTERGRHKEAMEYIYAEMAKRIKSWDFLGDDRKPLADMPDPTVEWIAKLEQSLQSRLIAVVYTQDDPGDEDPAVDNKPVSANEEIETQKGN